MNFQQRKRKWSRSIIHIGKVRHIVYFNIFFNSEEQAYTYLQLNDMKDVVVTKISVIDRYALCRPIFWDRLKRRLF
jgi:hypothetical protein